MIRLLLDAHISGRVVGKALRKDGHDVYALDAEKDLEGMEDPDVLELAISEGRVVVTANVGDFMALITKRVALQTTLRPLFAFRTPAKSALEALIVHLFGQSLHALR